MEPAAMARPGATRRRPPRECSNRKRCHPRWLESIIDMPAAVGAKQACQRNGVAGWRRFQADRRLFFDAGELHVLAICRRLRMSRALDVKQGHIKKVFVLRQAKRRYACDLDLLAVRIDRKTGFDRHLLSCARILHGYAEATNHAGAVQRAIEPSKPSPEVILLQPEVVTAKQLAGKVA